MWKLRCLEKKVQFTTCYIGNGEDHFWKFQDYWSNKKDCCNVKDRVSSFKSDARQIAFAYRLKHVGGKDYLPTSERLHEALGLPKLSPQERPSPQPSL